MLVCFSMLLFFPGCAISGDKGAETGKFKHKAYAWSGNTINRDNVFVFGRMNHETTPEQMKAATDKMPKGHKVLFSWDVHRGLKPRQVKRMKKKGLEVKESQKYGLHDHPEDNPIIWEKGAKVVGDRFDKWFAEYKRIGGEVDFFVLDFESGMSNWHYRNKPEIFKKISDNPESAKIAKDLGFEDLSKVYKYMSGDSYLRWNAAMKPRVCDYVNKATFNPIKKHFPDVQMSNYSDFYYNSKYNVPDTNGHKIYKYGHGGHVGTHQSPVLYCGYGQLERKKMDGKNKYAKNPFNGFRFAINRLRTAALSSDVPLNPWISHKNYHGSLVRKSDLYQEVIFHTGLTGVDKFLLWNPAMWRKDKQNPDHYRDDVQDMLVSDCLLQLDEVAGENPRKTLIKNLVPWGQDYALTGMRLPDKTVWRFTPKMAEGQTMKDFIVKSNPATFKVGDELVAITGGVIQKPKTELSKSGVWVFAPKKAKVIKTVN